MALVNQAKREINSKMVFFGPGLAGKSSNLKHVYGKLKPEFRGAMKAMNVQEARMLFFDFTPPGDGNVEGFRVRFHVYTVSGNVVDPAAWKMVLKGVDGIVFVADSDPQRLQANLESLENLTGFLKGYGQSLSSIPIVFQFNKSDLADSRSQGELERALNPSGLPSFKASSQSGEGVLQTLLSLVKTILTSMRSKGIEAIGSGEALKRMVEPETTAAAPEEAPPVPRPVQAPAVQEPPAEESVEEAVEEPPEAGGAQPEGEEPFAQPEAAAAQGNFAAESATEAGFGEAAGSEVGFGEYEAPLDEPLSLELSGAPQPAGAGEFRIPLTIRSGSRSRSVTLTISLSLEEG